MSAVERAAEVIVRHQRIPIYGHIPNLQRCTGCDHLHGQTDGPNSPRHAAHVAQALADAGLLADTTRAHTAADEFAAEYGHAHPWVAKIRALGGGEC